MLKYSLVKQFQSNFNSLCFVTTFTSKPKWKVRQKINLQHEKDKKIKKHKKYDYKKIIEKKRSQNPEFFEKANSIDLESSPRLFKGVFQDEKYAIINKAHQVSLQTDWQNKQGLISKLRYQDPHARNFYKMDKNMTGGLLVAKSEQVAKSFTRNLKLGGNKGFKLTRRYVGLIPSGNLECNFTDPFVSLQFYNDINKGRITSTNEEGRESVIDFIRYDKMDIYGYQLIILQLTSGENHQIRSIVSNILNKPLRNDRKNGALDFLQPQNCIGLHSAFIETQIGMKKKQFLIPVEYGITLWRGFVDSKGNFSNEVQDIIVNFEKYLQLESERER